jgi:hypothetical protein
VPERLRQLAVIFLEREFEKFAVALFQRQLRQARRSFVLRLTGRCFPVPLGSLTRCAAAELAFVVVALPLH